MSSQSWDVSVPLRGLWFLSMACSVTTSMYSKSFRPLAGIMVLIDYCEKNDVTWEGVSVPLRGLWFLSQELRPYFHMSDLFVSVPLRGLWFLSNAEVVGIIEIVKCFRPLAGIMVLIDCRHRRPQGHMEEFPSPCGDYGSYQLVSAWHSWKANSVSVPLRGLWFLSKKVLTFPCKRSIIRVSVPLRGLWFLSLESSSGPLEI